MPQQKRDVKSGALIFKPTTDEKQIIKERSKQKQIIPMLEQVLERTKAIENNTEILCLLHDIIEKLNKLDISISKFLQKEG